MCTLYIYIYIYIFFFLYIYILQRCGWYKLHLLVQRNDKNNNNFLIYFISRFFIEMSTVPKVHEHYERDIEKRPVEALQSDFAAVGINYLFIWPEGNWPLRLSLVSPKVFFSIPSPMEFWFLAIVTSGLLSWGHLISSDITDLIAQILFNLN